MFVRVRGWATTGILGLALVGCGSSQTSTIANEQQSGPSLPTSPALHSHPQAIQPVAGATGQPQGSGGASGPAVVSVGGPSSSGALAQPISDAEVRKELAASGLTANSNQATLTSSGLAIAPV